MIVSGIERKRPFLDVKEENDFLGRLGDIPMVWMRSVTLPPI
jgi:hypothetical protein